jgi:hypothetical protein
MATRLSFPGDPASIVTGLSWKEDDLEASLAELYRYSEEQANQVSTWYWRSKAGVALRSRFLRFLAVVLLTIGGLAPLVKAAFPMIGTRTGIDIAQLGYVFLAGGGACLGLDKYLGYSSAWSRYILAATAITMAISDFRLNWIGLTAKRRGQSPKDEDLTALIELCKVLNTKVNTILQDETVSWDKEARSLQSELDAKAKSGSPSSGAK